MKQLLLSLICFSLTAMDLSRESQFEIRKSQNGDFVGTLFERERTTTVKRYHHDGKFKYHCVAIMSTGEIKQVPVKKDDLHFLMLKIKNMHQQERLDATKDNQS